ncbi:MAG: hypothetical protein P1P59_07585, partial [Treponemataceae bacterium]
MDATEFVENLTEEQKDTLKQQKSISETYRNAAKKNAEKEETRGRKPKQPPTAAGELMDIAARKEKEKELSIQEVDKTYLPEGENYNLSVVLDRAKFYQAQAATSLIELGKQIILLKAHEPHGQFLAALEDLGMAERSARYAMAAAQKFSNRHTCADLGSAKIRALTVLDDDSIKTLEDGGELTGIGTLDEIEKMTVKELKAALRAEKQKRKEEREAQEAAISQKEQKLNELEMELRYREPPTKEQLAQAELNELKKQLFRQVGEASHAVHLLLQTIGAAQKIPN